MSINNLVSLSSDDVLVFPAGFRSSEYNASAQLTEENLTLFKLLSTNSENNSFFIEQYGDSSQKTSLLGLDGYIFIIPHTDTLDSANYVSIALRKIGTAGWVLTNIHSLIESDGAASSDILDDDTDTKFEGLYFSDDKPSLSIINPNNTKVMSYQLSELSKNLRLDASEIRNIPRKTDDTTEAKAITECFTTEKLDATDASISSIELEKDINNLSIYLSKDKGIILTDNDNVDDVNNLLDASETSVVLNINDNINIQKEVKITDSEIALGGNFTSSSGQFKAHNITIETENVDKATLTLERDLTIPKSDTTKIQVLTSNANTEKWLTCTNNNEANTLVFRDGDGDISINDLTANSINDVNIKVVNQNMLEISTNGGKNIDRSKIEIAKGINLEVGKTGADEYLAVIKANDDGSSDTVIGIRDSFNTTEGATVEIKSPLVITEKVKGVKIDDSSIAFNSNNGAESKTLTLTGNLTLPANNTNDVNSIPIQTKEGEWNWYPVTEESSGRHIPLTDEYGRLHVELASIACIGTTVSRANTFKVNSKFGVNDSDDIFDDGNKENIRPLLFVEKTVVASRLEDSSNGDSVNNSSRQSLDTNKARYADASMSEDIYLDGSNNIYFKDKNLNCHSVNTVVVKNGGDVNTVSELTVKGKVGLKNNIAGNTAILELAGDLKLPSNSLGVNDSSNEIRILSQSRNESKQLNSSWTLGTSKFKPSSVVLRDSTGNSSFNNITLDGLKGSGDYALYISKDGVINSESFTTVSGDIKTGDATTTVVSDVNQKSNGKIEVIKSNIKTAANNQLGLVKGVFNASAVSGRDYKASITSDGEIIVNVPWEEVELTESGEQGQVVLNQMLPDGTLNVNIVALHNLTTSGDPLFNTVKANTFLGISDVRLKENIQDYKCAKSILDLPIKKFDYINGPKNMIGCIAQDLMEICPELVTEDKDGYLSINESKLIYLLIQEVKALKDIVNKLK